jgi:hypothetical protein
MINRLACGSALIAVALTGTAVAGAQPTPQPSPDAARADAVFTEAMQLRSAGRDAEACPKFAESQRLAPAVGVTLYLADCYERTGRTASAWREFRGAEKLARDHNDKRADVAAQRAAALESGLYRLTVEPPVGASGVEVQIDGAAMTADSLNVALAVDPGDHVVTVTAPGQAPRTLHTHLDASNPSAIVRTGEPAESAAPATTAAVVHAEAAPPPSNGDAGARWGATGLVVAGALGIGIGTFFVTSKTRVMDDGQLCEPHLRAGAIPIAAVAFSAGGIALISGITLYYLHRPGRAEVSLAPAVIPGGAGAMFRAAF